MILDEATSALDTDTEKKVQLALSTLCKDRTTMIIAHRLSTISAADLIIVLHLGKIIEMGSHEQLVSRKHGRYAAMWTTQIRAGKAESGVAEDSLGYDGITVSDQS